MRWKITLDKTPFFLGAVAIFVPTTEFVANDVYRVLSNYSGDQQGYGRDFVQSWAASNLLREGRLDDLYGIEQFDAYLKGIFGNENTERAFLYPPHGLFVFLPFGYAPYFYSYGLWCIVLLGLYLLAIGLKTWSPWSLFYAVLAPTTLLVLNFGQTGLLTGALFLGGMRLVDRNPIYAGVLIGLLSFKPNLGLLIPFALLSGRLWIPFAAASLTIAAMVAVSLMIGGFDLWHTYLEQSSIPIAVMWLEQGSGDFTYMMQTPFMSARLLGFEASFSYAVQLVLAAVALISVVWSFGHGKNRVLQIAILATATFLVSPYLFNYDMALLLGAVILLLNKLPPMSLGLGKQFVFLLVWSLPLVGMALNGWGIPLGPLFLLAMLVVLLREQKKIGVT